MSDESAVHAISALASLAGILIAVCWLYREYRIDLFRQQMFEVRDRFFDYAADGGISLEAPAYQLVRTTMNGFIRFGDRIGPAAVFVGGYIRALQPDTIETFEERLALALEGLTQEQRERVSAFVGEMNFHVVEQVLYSSPVLLVVLYPIAWALSMKEVGARAWKRVFAERGAPRGWIRGLDTLALSYGTPQFG